MSKKDKLIQKARNNPYGLRFTELQTLCEIAGMRMDRSNGSHFVYVRENPTYTYPIQEGKNGEAKYYQVIDILGIYDEVNAKGE